MTLVFFLAFLWHAVLDYEVESLLEAFLSR